MPWIRWAVIGSLATAAIPARAELPPQFTTWADFAAVTAQSSIPYTLGIVERIERTAAGTFIVRGGGCYVEVTVIRESAKGPNGEPLVGGSHIAKVEVGEKRCGP